MKRSRDTPAVTLESTMSHPKKLREQSKDQHAIIIDILQQKQKNTSSHNTTYNLEGTNEADSYEVKQNDRIRKMKNEFLGDRRY